MYKCTKKSGSIKLYKNGSYVGSFADNSTTFNSDASNYGGSGVSNAKKTVIEAMPYDGRDYSAELLLPPLSVTVFKI